MNEDQKASVIESEFSVLNENSTATVYVQLLGDYKKRKVAAKLATKCISMLHSIDTAVSDLVEQHSVENEDQEAMEQLTWANMEDVFSLNMIANALCTNSN